MPPSLKIISTHFSTNRRPFKSSFNITGKFLIQFVLVDWKNQSIYKCQLSSTRQAPQYEYKLTKVIMPKWSYFWQNSSWNKWRQCAGKSILTLLLWKNTHKSVLILTSFSDAMKYPETKVSFLVTSQILWAVSIKPIDWSLDYVKKSAQSSEQ